MGIEQIAAAVSSAAGTQGAERVIALGPSGGAGPAEAGRFAASLDRVAAAQSNGSTEMASPFGNMLRALDGIDMQARSLTDYAQGALASGGQMTPGEIVQLTMKAQEFMFQAQLTSNIANRSADGVQQLFRQQG
jgi:hypothetical protein